MGFVEQIKIINHHLYAHFDALWILDCAEENNLVVSAQIHDKKGFYERN